MSEKKRILLLGATGSIGRQTLDVLRRHPDTFELAGISAGHNEDALQEIAQEFPEIQAASVESTDGRPWQTDLITGADHVARLMDRVEYDLLVNAVVGFAGLAPTLKALESGHDVALANKESLVAGGPLVKKTLAETGRRLYPIDSEHSAIWQCLQGSREKDVNRLIITASGGSFRDRSRESLKDATPAEALKHPNWAMGKRITIDSATMVNKGFEVIEAHYLFDVPFERIETVLHPQSIVHSMVEFKDGAVMAQLGSADMRLPIQYALMMPDRPSLEEDNRLDMTRTQSLEFREMDMERFPILKTAYETGKAGGSAGAVFNGADEEAVALFLEGKLPFLGIEDAIRYALQVVPFVQDPDYAALRDCDRLAREAVRYGVSHGFQVE